MKQSIWQGKRVRLRAVEPADWEVFYDWNQDDDMARRLYHVPFPQSREAVRLWVERLATQEPQGEAFHFAVENLAGELVGSIATHDCDRRNGTLSYGLNIRPEHRRRGYAAEAIIILLRYYFQELRYQKATVQVYSFNEASIRLHEKLGFQREGCLRRTIFTQGQYFDVIVLGLTVEEYDEYMAGREPTKEAELLSGNLGLAPDPPGDELRVRQSLLAETLTAPEVAARLGVSRQTPHDRVRAGALLAVMDRGMLRFPAWQFDPAGPGGALAGLPEVIRALGDMPALSKIGWMVSPKALLPDAPVEMLRQGTTTARREVLRAAEAALRL